MRKDVKNPFTEGTLTVQITCSRTGGRNTREQLQQVSSTMVGRYPGGMTAFPEHVVNPPDVCHVCDEPNWEGKGENGHVDLHDDCDPEIREKGGKE